MRMAAYIRTLLGIATVVLSIVLGTTVAAPVSASESHAAETFPVRSMSISHNPQAPADTVWVDIEYGSEERPSKWGFAVPDDTTPLNRWHDKNADSAECKLLQEYNNPCWDYWLYVPGSQEARGFAWWKGEYCVIVGSSKLNSSTRVNCNGSEWIEVQK